MFIEYKWFPGRGSPLCPSDHLLRQKEKLEDIQSELSDHNVLVSSNYLTRFRLIKATVAWLTNSYSVLRATKTYIDVRGDPIMLLEKEVL